ncbi:MAG: hypothetical protein Solumvirus2_53 [Solumvirus sp.]|uniref:Uncharacterized protein n=1 Tax=Solumvirus sp. TaxID=2487773 RepID=A0A3G5AG95_9VIRU|nr:MAG: hypothetical protein Solumvirus2_53 [Solumvirus sp.]
MTFRNEYCFIELSSYFNEKGIIKTILDYDFWSFMEIKVKRFFIKENLEKWEPFYLWDGLINRMIVVMIEIDRRLRNSTSSLTEDEIYWVFRGSFHWSLLNHNSRFIPMSNLRAFVSEMMVYFKYPLESQKCSGEIFRE